MSGHRGNIDIAGSGLPDRLQQLRLERGWSKADLAERAGLTWRAVHDIETGKRSRILEHTLLALARALAVPPEELLGRPLRDAPGSAEDDARPRNPVAPPPGRERRRLVLAALASALALGAIAVHAMRSSVGIPLAVEAEGATLVIERRLLPPLRFGPYKSEVRSWTIAPWRGHRVVVFSLGPSGEDGGTTFAVDASTGKVLWTLTPPYDRLASFFGADLARTGSYGNTDFHGGAGSLLFGDLDGDSDPELIVAFGHETWFPAYVDVVRSDGTRLGSYLNWGRLYAGAVADLDNDGKDEVVVAGTSNARCYQGSTVILLDDEHCSGASADSLVGAGCGLADRSLARLVLPIFAEPYRELLRIDRLETKEVLISRDEQGDPRIVIDVGAAPGGEGFIVTLDGALRPLSIAASDAFVRATGDWPEEVRTAFLAPDNLSSWLAGHRYFGALALRAPGRDVLAADGSFAAPAPAPAPRRP